MRKHAAVAIQNGSQFLVAAQQPDGFWRDYDLVPGASTAWVTAFVGHALTRARCANPGSIARGLSALRSSFRPTGWGYNAAVATDADTTSWVVRWFARTNTALPLDPVSCLEAYVSPNGGARTFVCGSRFGRWTMEHADVTAVLGLAMKESGAAEPALARVRRWLLERRNDDGLWTSFWWTFDGYTAARTLEFLAGTGGIPADTVEASRAYLAARPDAPTSMETANLLMIAHRVCACTEARLSSLLDRQQPDGGWPPSRVLKVPDQRATRATETAFEDHNGLMSTAMSVMAITAFLDEGRGHA